MKVVLFCGGYGMRMRDGVRDVPKPMAMVGERPLIWHVMRYYAHFGHREFILCMGYGAAHISEYFLNYDETRSNDFVIDRGEVALMGSDVANWTITFVHTGLDTPIGERLRRVREHLAGDDVFLANYADVLTDAPLNAMIDQLRASDAVASLIAVPPQAAFHIIDSEDDGRVVDIRSVATLPLRENGGYFVMRAGLLDELRPGDDLVGDTLTRLSHQGRVLAYRHDGFWMPADTVKERAAMEALAVANKAPWQVWLPNSQKPSRTLMSDPPVMGGLATHASAAADVPGTNGLAIDIKGLAVASHPDDR